MSPNNQKNTIVVTGGAGFIGSNVVAHYCERGDTDVVVCDHLGDDNIKWRNLAKHALDNVIFPAELMDWLKVTPNIRIVIHMGAVSSTTAIDADHVIRSNFRLSRDIWKWCTDTQTPLIYASSAATYGDGSNGFLDENELERLHQLRPLNLYGWSKQLFDLWVLRQVANGRPTPPTWAGLKFFNVFGPNETHKGDMMSVVAKNYGKCARGDTVSLFKSHHPDYEDGGQLRDFVYVKDCVRVIEWLADTCDANGIYNVGTGKARSFADLISAEFEACGHSPMIEYVDMPIELRDRYQYFTQAEMSRLRSAGYPHEFTPMEDAVAEYVTRYLAKPDPFR